MTTISRIRTTIRVTTPDGGTRPIGAFTDARLTAIFMARAEEEAAAEGQQVVVTREAEVVTVR